MMPLRLAGVWWSLGLLGVLGSSYLMLTPHPPSVLSAEHADKVEHVLGFMLIYLWFAQLLERRGHHWLVLWLLVYGALIEVLQGLGGARAMELADLLADGAGLLLGWLIARSSVARLLFRIETFFLGR